MVKLFALAGRPGAYLRIVEEGEIEAGDEVDITARPSHGVTVAQVSKAIMLDESGLAAAAAAPELPESLSSWMLERAA
jgi:MOSC domain-containing protein YiiM